MNPTTSREFCATNYYAGQLQHYFPNQCKHPALFIRNDDIKAEFYKRIGLFTINKFSLLPCLIAEPTEFMITASVALVFSSVATTFWNVRYPPIPERQSRWKDYFESTAILNEKAAKIFILAVTVHAVANIITSSLWPNDMVWYNALYVGLSIGIITSKMILHPNMMRPIYYRLNGTEPLLQPEVV
jgi:hypothetical protein